jgi:phage-related protein
MNWEVLFYVTSGGQPVVEKFVEGLDKVARAKTLRQIDLLKIYGSDLGMPHSKALGGGLVELRVRGQREVRIFYVFAKGKQIFMLHGFIKKTQATPKKELDIARTRQQEIENL